MPRRWILDDAERAFLASLHAQGIGPMEAFGTDRAFAGAADTHGYEPKRLTAAVGALIDKGLIEPLDGGRLRMSKDGFLASHQAAEALKAGIVPF